MSLLASSSRRFCKVLALAMCVQSSFALPYAEDPSLPYDPELVLLASSYRLALVSDSEPPAIDDIADVALPTRSDGLAFATTQRSLGLVIDPYSARVLRAIAWNGPPAQRISLADGVGRAFVLDQDGGIWLFDIERGEVLWEIPPSGFQSPVAFAASADGSFVALADADGTIKLFDADGVLANPSSLDRWPTTTWKSLAVSHLAGHVLVVACDGERLAVGGLNGPQFVMSLGSLSRSSSPQAHDPGWALASSFVFAPNLRTLAFLRAGSLYRLDVANRKLTARPAPGILKIESLSDSGELHAVSTRGAFSLLTLGADGPISEVRLSPPPSQLVVPTDASSTLHRVAVVRSGRLSLLLPAGSYSQVLVISSQTGRVVDAVPVTHDLSDSAHRVADLLLARMRQRLDPINPALDQDRVARAPLHALSDIWVSRASQLLLGDFTLVGTDPPVPTRGSVLHLFSKAMHLAALVCLPPGDQDTLLSTELSLRNGSVLHVRRPLLVLPLLASPGEGLSLVGRQGSLTLPTPLSWIWSVSLGDLCASGRCPVKWSSLYLPSLASPLEHPGHEPSLP